MADGSPYPRVPSRTWLYGPEFFKLARSVAELSDPDMRDANAPMRTLMRE